MKMMKVKGFTLVELLVVISIIAMLLSILMPSLNKARKAAQGVVCGSNQRQLSMGMRLYSENNKGRAPAFGMAAGDYWQYKIAPYLNSKEYAKDPVKALKSGMATMLCPSTKRQPPGITSMGIYYNYGTAKLAWRNLEGTGTGSGYSDGSYGLNLWLAPEFTAFSGAFPTRKCWPMYSVVPRAASVPVFGDCNWVGGWPDGDNFATRNTDTGIQWGASNQENLGRYLLSRHGRAINVAFVDGHGEKVPLYKLWDLKWCVGYKKTYTIPSWFMK